MANATFQPKSSALGITSVSMATVVIAVAGGVALSNVSWQAGTLYIVSGYRDYTALAYLCGAVCLLGFVFGVEGFRRPTSQKVLAVAGALLNFSLMASMIVGPAVVKLLSGPIE